MTMGRENPAEQTLKLLRSRLCNPSFIFSAFSEGTDSNYSKLKFIVSSSVTEACNNSVLLLGPRGCGKTAVLELVLKDVVIEYPDMISVIRLNGMLHADDNCAIKEIARQLCLEHQLSFSKMVSFDDNSQFMIAMLHECGLAHKTIIFVLDEFDLFSQAIGNQTIAVSPLQSSPSKSPTRALLGVSGSPTRSQASPASSDASEGVDRGGRLLVSESELKASSLQIEAFKIWMHHNIRAPIQIRFQIWVRMLQKMYLQSIVPLPEALELKGSVLLLLQYHCRCRILVNVKLNNWKKQKKFANHPPRRCTFLLHAGGKRSAD